MTPTRYIYLTNWARAQHDKRRPGMPWYRDWRDELDLEPYMELSLAACGLLARLRKLYAELNGSPATAPTQRGISEDRARRELVRSASDARRVREHLESLSDAGFLVLSASETLAAGSDPRALELEGEEDKPSSTPLARVDEPGESVTPSASSSSRGYPPDPVGEPVWLELARLFGDVEPKTRAHGARHVAYAELQRYGATVELIRLAATRWPKMYPTATLTDVALARHWPQVTQGARAALAAACPDCGTGGGFHSADCPRAAGEEAAA